MGFIKNGDSKPQALEIATSRGAINFKTLQQGNTKNAKKTTVNDLVKNVEEGFENAYEFIKEHNEVFIIGTGFILGASALICGWRYCWDPMAMVEDWRRIVFGDGDEEE
jgi:hypothetical protein